MDIGLRISMMLQNCPLLLSLILLSCMVISNRKIANKSIFNSSAMFSPNDSNNVSEDITLEAGLILIARPPPSQTLLYLAFLMFLALIMEHI